MLVDVSTTDVPSVAVSMALPVFMKRFKKRPGFAMFTLLSRRMRADDLGPGPHRE